jgi:hypothetical protein
MPRRAFYILPITVLRLEVKYKKSPKDQSTSCKAAKMTDNFSGIDFLGRYFRFLAGVSSTSRAASSKSENGWVILFLFAWSDGESVRSVVSVWCPVWWSVWDGGRWRDVFGVKRMKSTCVGGHRWRATWGSMRRVAKVDCLLIEIK